MRVRLLLMACALPLSACPPPCGQVCRKVLFDCELDSERVAFEECEASCERQDALYQQWEDETLQDLFDDHRRCIARSSCDELAEGACYEGYEALFVFDPDKQPLPPSTLTLDGTGYGNPDGTAVVGRVRGPDGAVLASDTAATASGGFRLVFASVLETAVTYTVDWFVDLDGNGTCGGAEAFVAYRTTLVQTASDRERTLTVDAVGFLDPAACVP